MQPKVLFWGILVRSFEILGVTTKLQDNPGILRFLAGIYMCVCSQPRLWSRKLLELWCNHFKNQRTNRDKGTLRFLYLLLIKTDKVRSKRGVSKKSKGVRTHNWGSNTTSINKARSYKPPSTTEKVCWITFKTSGITSKICVQRICVKEIILNPPGRSSFFKWIFSSKQ